MQALPPKHLARRGSRSGLARNPEYVFESLTALAVILVVATIFANLPDRSGSSTASRGEAAATTGGPAGAPPAGAGTRGNLVPNWSFEQDLDGWEVLGPAAADREPQGRTSGSCASVRARGPEPGRIGLRLPAAVSDAPRGGRYVASVWVRSTAPGLTVTVRLAGTAGSAEASSSQASTLPGLLWRRVFVAHTVAEAGADLAFEITADGVPAGDSLLVDEILIRKG